MRADYDDKANAISILLVPRRHAEQADQVHPRAVVALDGGTPVELQLLYPDLGVEGPLSTVALRYELDREALIATAQAALAAPNRSVTVDVAVHSAA